MLGAHLNRKFKTAEKPLWRLISLEWLFLFYSLLILFYQIVNYFTKMYCILSKKWYYIVVRKLERSNKNDGRIKKTIT